MREVDGRRKSFAEGDLGSDSDIPNMLDRKKLVPKWTIALLERLCPPINQILCWILVNIFQKGWRQVAKMIKGFKNILTQKIKIVYLKESNVKGYDSHNS